MHTAFTDTTSPLWERACSRWRPPRQSKKQKAPPFTWRGFCLSAGALRPSGRRRGGFSSRWCRRWCGSCRPWSG
ncbi:hypothetical protein CGA22_23760 [Pseudomonas sp. PSB18]|nr:hypothetical protein [Pseudomonas sp. PSB18]